MTYEVGDSIVLKSKRWSFSSPHVIDSFDFHVENSVPLYHQGHELVLGYSDFFLSKDSVCYDLGCATARLSTKLAQRHQDVSVFAVDIEEGMLEQAKARCEALPNIKLQHDDITQMRLAESDLIISYYTMQFIAPKLRTMMLQKIYQALNVGSAFIMFEKVYEEDAQFQDMANLIHADKKLDNGYDPNEIFAKANSLKGVLKPRHCTDNLKILQSVGFTRTQLIMKYLCFEGYLALK